MKTLALLVGIALGFVSFVRIRRAESDAAADSGDRVDDFLRSEGFVARPLPPSEPPRLSVGSGGGGKGEGIGLGGGATCRSYSAPRWCAHRIAAPGAWPDAAVSIEALVVTPPDSAEAMRAEIEPLLVTPPPLPPRITSDAAPRSREDAEYDALFERHFPNPYAWDHLVASRGTDIFAPNSHLKGQLAECYREALTADATVTGRVALRLRLDTVKVARNTTGDRILARCVAASLSGLRFREGTPRPVEARVTLLFRRGR